MLWLLVVLLVFGFPLMLLFAALSISFWLVGAVLALIWGIVSFVLNDAAVAALVVAALFIGYRYGRNREKV